MPERFDELREMERELSGLADNWRAGP